MVTALPLADRVATADWLMLRSHWDLSEASHVCPLVMQAVFAAKPTNQLNNEAETGNCENKKERERERGMWENMRKRRDREGGTV